MSHQSIRADELQEGDVLLGQTYNCIVTDIMVCGPETIIFTDTGNALDVLSNQIASIQPRQPNKKNVRDLESGATFQSNIKPGA